MSCGPRGRKPGRGRGGGGMHRFICCLDGVCRVTNCTCSRAHDGAQSAAVSASHSTQCERDDTRESPWRGHEDEGEGKERGNPELTQLTAKGKRRGTTVGQLHSTIPTRNCIEKRKPHHKMCTRSIHEAGARRSPPAACGAKVGGGKREGTRVCGCNERGRCSALGAARVQWPCVYASAGRGARHWNLGICARPSATATAAASALRQTFVWK
jgi:hypothetical protein